MNKALIGLIQVINSEEFEEVYEHTIKVLKAFERLMDNFETTEEIKKELSIIINDKNKITDCFV